MSQLQSHLSAFGSCFVLFLVHCTYPRPVTVYHRIFYPTSITVPGFNLTHPVILPPIISAKAFASLLWVIYNVHYGTHITTKDEWSNILVTAIALGFEQIKELTEFKWNIADRKEA
jgi:hypothetical protein